MEFFIVVFLLIIAVYVLVALVVYVIAPIAGVVLAGTIIASIGFAFFTSIRSFISSLISHRNPYTTYVDKSPMASSTAKRNFFFGPGYHQVSITVTDAFLIQQTYLLGLSAWMERNKSRAWYLSMWVLLGYVAAVFCTLGLGFAWMSIFSILLSTILVTGMCCFYVFFSLLWVADRLTLTIKAIQSRCPHCKRISIVPDFTCPDCGMAHKNLTPGPYGVLTRKCSCGKKLSTTCFNGRSSYNATCPFCASEMATSGAQQIGIQLVGGVSTGKTTFLAAFWHEYMARLKTVAGLSVTAVPEDAFTELEHWFQNGDSAATTEMNATMYSLIHNCAGKTPIQMTIYDIAGEAFTSLNDDIQQQQFQYCEGIIFVVDPTTNPEHISETVSNFVNEFTGLSGKHSMKTSSVPVAVVITKADQYAQQIGLPRIRSIFNTNSKKYADDEGNASLEKVRDGICREFLDDRGFGNALNLVDATFSKVQYYAASAMGHPAQPGQRYEPWGVLEPISWLLQQQGTMFHDITSRLL